MASAARAAVERVVRQRRQALRERGAADGAAAEIERVIETIRDRAKNALRGGDDFRTDAVAREQENRGVQTP